MSAPRYVPQASPPTLKARPESPRQLKPAGFLCELCRLVLLETPQLAEVTREQLEALIEAGGEVGPAEAYRHRFVRERWQHALMWSRVQGRPGQ